MTIQQPNSISCYLLIYTESLENQSLSFMLYDSFNIMMKCKVLVFVSITAPLVIFGKSCIWLSSSAYSIIEFNVISIKFVYWINEIIELSFLARGKLSYPVYTRDYSSPCKKSVLLVLISESDATQTRLNFAQPSLPPLSSMRENLMYKI